MKTLNDFKHIKINLSAEEVLEKLQNKETLKAYTEGYEEDTTCYLRNERNRVIVDYYEKGGGNSLDCGPVITKRTKNPERIEECLSNIEYAISEVNGSSVPDEEVIDMRMLLDYFYSHEEAYTIDDFDKIKREVDLLDPDELEYYLDEMVARSWISYNDGEYYHYNV
jgi:hypothetical protein